MALEERCTAPQPRLRLRDFESFSYVKCLLADDFKNLAKKLDHHAF